MSEVITPVIKVDVGESQQTVKGLKKEISDLKDRILNLTKGSDEYNKAVNQLQANQRKLNEVMALSKKEAVALDGSYDALTHQMALLRKEWKATNDEAKRNELGKQIDAINDQLKELDGSIGNFQRNVGNYQSALDGVGDSAKKAGKDVVAASAAPKDFGAAMREMNETIEPTKQKFEAVGNIASGLAGGFAAAQGAMALLGVESEGFEKTMIKIQSAMAIAQGISGMKGLVEGIGKAKVAFQGLGDKIKAVSKTMGKAGWLGVILTVIGAIGALVSAMKSGGKEAEEFAEKQEKIKETNDNIGESIGNVIAEFNLLKKEYSKLNNPAEKQKWIEENASAFEKLGLNINSVNTADDVFYNNTPKIIAALKARAKAEALTEEYKRKVIEAEQAKQNLELPTYSYKNNQEQGKPIEFTGPSVWKPYYKENNTTTSQTTVKTSSPTGGYRTLVLQRGYWKPTITPDEAFKIPALQPLIQKMYDDIDAKIIGPTEEAMDLAQTEALNAWEELGNIGKPSTTTTTTTTKSTSKKEFVSKLSSELQELLKGIQTNYDRQIEEMRISGKDANTIAEEIYKLQMLSEKEQLTKIKEYLTKAETNKETVEATIKDLESKIKKAKGDKKKQLEEQLATQKQMLTAYEKDIINLNEAIKDQDLAIKVVEYEEKQRLREVDLENEKKALESAERLYQESLRKASSTYGTVEKKQRGWFGSLVGSLVGVDSMDEHKREKAQQENDSNYYAAAYEAEQKFLNDKLALKKAALADERNTDEEKLTYQQEIADIELAIEQSKYAEEDRLRQEKVKKEKETQNKIKAIYGSSLQATSDLLNGIADAYESSAKREDESEAEQEKSAKKVKNLRIAAATIDMLQGATTAFSSAMQLGPIAGPIVGGVNAAAVVAMGIANINKIKNTNTDGSDVGGTGAATPSMGSYTNDTPYSYTRQLTGASETDSLNQDTRVYILESDIQASNKKVQIRESESSF